MIRRHLLAAPALLLPVVAMAQRRQPAPAEAPPPPATRPWRGGNLV